MQTLDIAPTVLDDAVHPASELPILLERVYGRVLFGQEIRDWSVSREDRTLTFHVTSRADVPFDINEVREALRDAEGVASPDPGRPAPHRRRARRRPAARADHRAAGAGLAARGRPGDAGGNVLDNGLLRAEVHTDGTLGLRTPSGHVIEGVGRIVDGGDLGDSYNYAPPAHDRIVGDPVTVDVKRVSGRSSPRSTSSGPTGGRRPATCLATRDPRPRRT